MNVTVLVPCAEPKFVPVIVISCPIVADETDRLAILGTGRTVKGTPFEVPFDVVITTFPVVAPLGTGTATVVPFQPVGVAAVPLKLTVLAPCTAPKFTPEIVTGVPTGPDVGDKLLMLGVWETVNGTPLLAVPCTVTTTFPEVAFIGTGAAILVGPHPVGVLTVPLNVTVLVPWLAPKFAPEMVMDEPGTAVLGERPLM